MRQTKPEEECRCSKQLRRLPKGVRTLCVDHGKQNECEEHERVCDVKRRFPQPEEEVETEDGHHPSAVQEIVIPCRGKDIGKRGDRYARLPDHQIVVVVAVERHPVVECKHERKNCRCCECRPQNRTPHQRRSYPSAYVRKFTGAAPAAAIASCTAGAQTAASSAAKS